MALKGVHCLKFFLFACNFIIFCIGIAVLGYGVWTIMDPKIGTYMGDQALIMAVKIFIGIGVAMVIASIIGCLGTFKNNQCLLGLFFVCCLILFVFLLYVGISGLRNQPETEVLRKEIDKSLQKAVNKYSSDKPSKQMMDYVQTKFECCGASSGLSDYGRENPRPESCKPENENTGCVDGLVSTTERAAIFYGGIFIGVAMFMLLPMLSSICLCCCIKRSQPVAI